MRNLIGGLIALAAVAAHADVAPPGQAECNNKKAGDKCTIGDAAGLCTASKCTRPDYSKGPPPTYRQVDCVLCVATATKKSEGTAAAPVLAAAAGLALLGGVFAFARRRRGDAGDRGQR